MLKIKEILCASSVLEEAFVDVGGTLYLSYADPGALDVNTHVNEAAKRFNEKLGVDIICPKAIANNELVDCGFDMMIELKLNEDLVGYDFTPAFYSNALSILPHFMAEFGVSKDEFEHLSKPFLKEYKEHFYPEEEEDVPNFKDFASLLSDKPPSTFFKYLLPEVKALYPKAQVKRESSGVITTEDCKNAILNLLNESDVFGEDLSVSDLKRVSKKKDNQGRIVRAFVIKKEMPYFDVEALESMPVFAIETAEGLKVQMIHPDEPVYFAINSDFIDPQFDLGEDTFCVATTRYLNNEIDDIQNDLMVSFHVPPDSGKSMENIFELTDAEELRAHMTAQGFIEVSKEESCERDFLSNASRRPSRKM